MRPTATAVTAAVTGPQTFAGRGTAVFVGNTGYGYGDFKTVALSERLMKLFAQNLDGNLDVGRALLEAKRDYYLSAGNYQGYDEKVLQQAVFYGLPMYHIDATPPAAPAAPAVVTDPVTGLHAAPLSVQPQFTQKTAIDGTTFASIDGDVQTANGYPIVPRTTVDVTQPVASGLIAHGALLTKLTAEESNVPSPAFARAGVGQQANEPAKEPASYAWPAQFATVNLLADEQKLVLLPEQLVSNDDGPGALRRRFTSLDALVYYAPANVTDIAAPRILATGATTSAAGTTFKVETTDAESGVARVVILYRSGNNYLPLDLTHVEGTNEWIGAVAGVSNPHFIAQSADAAGNIGTTSNKAVLHEANGKGAEFGIIFDGPVGDNDWYTATPDAILIGDIDPAHVGVTVNGGPSVPFSQFALPAADGIYDVVASTESTTYEVTAKVDHTAPTITTNPAITISTVFQVGQAVTLAVNCADPGAPNSSGVASCAPTSVTLDTSSPGTRSFTATATDNAGNVRTQTFTYVVAGPYQYTNVFPYTDRLNVVRAGWNLPLIFKAFAPSGAQITSTAFTTTVSAPQTCPSLTQIQLPQSSMVSNPNNLLFFDSALRNTVWIWKVPKPIPNASKPCFVLTAKATGDTGAGISWWVKLTP